MDWTRDLEQRLALATPDKTTRGMFLKGVLHVVKSLGDDEAVRRCLGAGGEPRITDFFAYPIASQLRMVFTAAEVLGERHGGFEEGLRLLGRQGATDFMGSLAGRTILALTGTHPVKLLDSLPTSYRASNSYGRQSVEWTGPTSGCFILQGEFMPAAYHCGVVEAVLMYADVQGVKVTGRQPELLVSECDFSWEP